MSHQPQQTGRIVLICLSLLMTFNLLCVAGPLAEKAPARFQLAGTLQTSAAEWISLDGDSLAYGTGRQVFITDTNQEFGLKTTINLENPIREAVLAGDQLFVIGTNGMLSVLDLATPEAALELVELNPEPQGRLSIARMDDYLVVAEDGWGLRVLALPMPEAMMTAGMNHAHGPVLPTIAMLPLVETIRAITTSVRTIYLMSESRQLIVVDAHTPNTLTVKHTMFMDRDVIALAANGPRLYMLQPDGMEIIRISDSGEVIAIGHFPDLTGTGAELAGRALYLAGSSRGVVAYQDRAPAATTHFVTVSDFVFTVANLIIAPGDTVQWDNSGGFHNAEACDGIFDPANCGGAVAVEPFTSGPASSAAWTFSKTFTLLGDNPYFCVVHGGGGMVGNVKVAPIADHFVTLSGISFTPATLVVSPGDVVQWDNLGGNHNVESCDGVLDPLSCTGTAVEGLFISGAPTSDAFTFQHQFNILGDNPYFCLPHAGLGMTGVVKTVSAVVAPPGVPSGGPNNPVTVEKLGNDGTRLDITFDTSACTGNTDHQIIYAPGSKLPAVLGGLYSPDAAECSIGGSSYIWNNVPDPSADSTRFLWFLVLATDGVSKEGSWGYDSAGGERNGQGAQGASTFCVTDKVLTNTCP